MGHGDEPAVLLGYRHAAARLDDRDAILAIPDRDADAVCSAGLGVSDRAVESLLRLSNVATQRQSAAAANLLHTAANRSAAEQLDPIRAGPDSDESADRQPRLSIRLYVRFGSDDRGTAPGLLEIHRDGLVHDQLSDKKQDALPRIRDGMDNG